MRMPQLEAHAQPVAAHARAHVRTADGAARARESRLDRAAGAAPVAGDGVVVVAALASPRDTPAVAAHGRARVEPADARAVAVATAGLRGARAREANL